MLSELFVRNPGTGECGFVYHCVSHAIWDGMSGEVFRSDLTMGLCGTGADAVAVSRIEPTGSGRTATEEGFMSCVDASCRELSCTQGQLVLEEVPVSQTQRLGSIVTLMGAYVGANRALRPLRTMPVMVLSNGRDALSGSPLGDFLTPRCGIFGVATQRVACAGPGAFEGAWREVDERLLRMPSSTSLACLAPNG